MSIRSRIGGRIGIRIRRQRGLTLIEAAIVLAIAAMSTAYFAQMIADNAEQVRAKGVSEKMTEVHEAAAAYIKAHQTELLDDAPTAGALVIPVGRPNATAAIPSGPGGLPSVQGGGFLPPGYVDRNSYNQRHALLVRKVTIDGRQTLDALVTTYGGNDIPDRQLTKIAGLVGAVGGYVPETPLPGDAGQVVGAYGGWRTQANGWGAAATRPTTGSLVTTMAYQEGSILADYLYRNDIGIAEANRMNTDIDVNGHNLGKVATIGGNEGALGIAGDVNVSSAGGGAGGIVAEGNLRTRVDVWAERDIKADRNLAVGNNVDVGNRLVVTGAANLRGGATVNGGAAINGGLTTSGLATFNNRIEVAGAATLQGGATVQNGAVLSGGTTMNGGSTTNGLATFNNRVDVKANADIQNNLTVGGNAHIGQGLVVDNDATIGQKLTAQTVQSNDVQAAYLSAAAKIYGGGWGTKAGSSPTLGELLPKIIIKTYGVVSSEGTVSKPTCGSGTPAIFLSYTYMPIKWNPKGSGAGSYSWDIISHGTYWSFDISIQVDGPGRNRASYLTMCDYR